MIGQWLGSLTSKAHAKRAARNRGLVVEYFKSKRPVMLCGTTEYRLNPDGTACLGYISLT
eukprot:scaffold126255_cov46-Cyclotella_meneghiniana.AAC.1